MVPQERNSQSQCPQCTFLMTGAPAENIEIIFNGLGCDGDHRLSSQEKIVVNI